MDVPTAKQYIDFIKELYPDKKVELIWDAASSHICAEIKQYVVDSGIISGYIPAGLTSILHLKNGRRGSS